jgi:hypothetical protein
MAEAAGLIGWRGREVLAGAVRAKHTQRRAEVFGGDHAAVGAAVGRGARLRRGRISRGESASVTRGVRRNDIVPSPKPLAKDLPSRLQSRSAPAAIVRASMAAE